MSRPAPRAIAAALLVAAAGAACSRGSAASAPAPAPTPASSPAPSAAPSTASATSAAATAESHAPAYGGHPPRAESGSYNPADARFMRGMIHHHAQALEMTALVPARTTREEMRVLAERIEVSQRDEIALMRRWLQDRGEAVPSDSGHAAMHAAMHAGAHGDMQHDSTTHAAHAAHAAHATMAGMPGMAHDSMPGMAPMPGMLTPAQMAQLAAAKGADFDRLFLTDMIQHHQGALKMVADLFATPGAGQEGEVFRLASDVEADQRAEIARMQALLGALSKR